MPIKDVQLEHEKLSKLKYTGPKETSVGVPAIASALKQMGKYMDPVDAFKLSLKINQKGGFDCPGCAWPDPDDDRSALGEYCENGIKAIAEEASKKSLKADYFQQHTIQEISKKSDFELGKLGRLIEPLVLNEGENHYQPISWENAFKLIAEELNTLDSPDEALFYTSGRTSNEAAYLYQLFVRDFGTNNLPDCSNMCHESSGVALSETVGIGKGSVTLQDLHEAEVIMVMGQNPGTNHPRMLGALEKCKENGGKIITVNPLPEAGLMQFTDPQSPMKMLTGGTKLTDVFAQVKINGDIAFLKAIMLKLMQWEEEHGNVLDTAFIKDKTSGFSILKEHLATTSFDECVRQSGVSEETITEVATLFANNNKLIICWAMGLTQHKNGVENIQEVVNLLLMRGAIGKPGAGTCPVRGHSNVQGDRTMGIWEAPKDSFLDNLEKEHGIKSPRHHGHAVVPAINAMLNKECKVFFAMGGNFLSATPDTHRTAEALKKCSLTVHVSTKLNRSHLVTGKRALILPCLGRTDKDIQKTGEQFVTCENSMGVVHTSQGVLNPPGKHLKSEVRIVAELAQATLPNSKVNYLAFSDNYDLIRDAVSRTIPGFENFNERVRKPGGFYLPNGARKQEFNTVDGKAHFTVNPLPQEIVKDDELVLMTIRSHDQYNTTIYGLDDRYRGIKNERRVILMNEADIKSRNLQQGDLVNLISHYQGEERQVNKFIVLPYPIPQGNAATYFPEANPLVPLNSFADKSLTPTSKFIRITLENWQQAVKSA
jgi:molybdopterin-dependent oxidoreductase alpha subunit